MLHDYGSRDDVESPDREWRVQEMVMLSGICLTIHFIIQFLFLLIFTISKIIHPDTFQQVIFRLEYVLCVVVKCVY